MRFIHIVFHSLVCIRIMNACVRCFFFFTKPRHFYLKFISFVLKFRFMRICHFPSAQTICIFILPCAVCKLRTIWYISLIGCQANSRLTGEWWWAPRKFYAHERCCHCVHFTAALLITLICSESQVYRIENIFPSTNTHSNLKPKSQKL